VVVGVALAGASTASGCASKRPTFDGTTYQHGEVAFRVGPMPKGWRRIKVSDASLSFRDDAHDGSVLVNARCGALDQDTPLPSLTAHLMIGTTEKDVGSQEVEPFDNREALHTKMTAKLDGVPRAFDIYVLKKDGCVYDFVYVAPPGDFEGGMGDFEVFVKGFSTTRGAS
jgi:hypothetical protein